MDYVQVPEERAESVLEVKDEIVEESKEVIKEKKKAELVKQMSLSTDGGGEFNSSIVNYKNISETFNSFGKIWIRIEHFRSLR